ncbi:unnamed protein product [Chrysodeixis includens]|uniref:Chloride channel CLIC-like protein 1 n=1 Tax=Chrysodeixis includens TaxID=689277 RepID=A0A9P0FWL0_CHRIL|nr:unnamed protein product [Chrysodeixis includens]
MSKGSVLFACLVYTACFCMCDVLHGPDPWNVKAQTPDVMDGSNLPPDIRMPLKKERPMETKLGFGEWWFKRLLAIMLKSGQLKKGEDGSVDISLQMRFDEDRWVVLEESLRADNALTDVMFRRTVGYVEDAIYKPTITEQIVMAWSEYIQFYLMEYKMYITLFFSALAGVGVISWLWRRMSHRHILVIIIVLLYIYEVVISYKEAEQKEYEAFVSVVNTCKWQFWTSECTIPPPDPLVFMRHMNPMKIFLRMFTTLISEPLLVMNSTIRIIIEGVTDGLWFPLNKIVCGLLLVIVNILLIILLFMVVFNFILNIPFNLSFLNNLVSIVVERNRPSVFSTNASEQQQPQIRDADRISGERLDRLLNVCSLALTNVTNVQHQTNTNARITGTSSNVNLPQIKRSASTGRLPDCSFENNNDQLSKNGNLRRRLNLGRGDGDHIR